jgi:hypothetical protein
MQAVERAPRWALKRLTATYVTLGLSDIARAVNIESEDEVRELVLSMVSVSPSVIPRLHLHVTRSFVQFSTDDGDISLRRSNPATSVHVSQQTAQ